MARTFSRNQQTYPAGTYGPFSIDSFTRDDAERLEATMTVVGWPNVSPLLVIEIAWDTGGKAVFTVEGEQRGIDGNILPEVKFGVSVPKTGGQKRDVSGGKVKVTANAPVTTAITFRAV